MRLVCTVTVYSDGDNICKHRKSHNQAKTRARFIIEGPPHRPPVFPLPRPSSVRWSTYRPSALSPFLSSFFSSLPSSLPSFLPPFGPPKPTNQPFVLSPLSSVSPSFLRSLVVPFPRPSLCSSLSPFFPDFPSFRPSSGCHSPVSALSTTQPSSPVRWPFRSLFPLSALPTALSNQPTNHLPCLPSFFPLATSLAVPSVFSPSSVLH